MTLLKKMDQYVLKNFLGIFFMTFTISCFILLMQIVWFRINDIVGKGVEVIVLLEFLFYAVISVVPMALPLAILLASLMTFGNLGERFELTAMKSAGISLFRIMRPLTIFIAILSIGAFFFSNKVLPKTQMKFWTLVFSLRQKSPELDIPVGEFYSGLNGYNIYVRHKDTRTGLLQDVMIYDYSNGFQNATVTVSDSGRVYFTDDHKYLKLCLYHGESFENLSVQQQHATHSQQNVPYRREMFTSKALLIDFNTEFSRFDESVMDDQHVSKDAAELMHSMDSVRVLARNRSREQSTDMIRNKYLGREWKTERQLPVVQDKAMARKFDVDSVYNSLSNADKQKVMNHAQSKAKAQQDLIVYNSVMLNDYQRYIRRHAIELHRKFTLAFACLIFFFIGAPLGAIIRKGGLGAPIVISVIMFIIYYIIDNTGYKLAREAIWPVWQGIWLSSFVLLPIGVFLTYKAAHDSGLFNPEVWFKYYERGMQAIQNVIHKIKK